MDDLGSMALHDITETLGERGLRDRFDIEVAKMPGADQARLRQRVMIACSLTA